jgi:hypothetical protein
VGTLAGNQGEDWLAMHRGEVSAMFFKGKKVVMLASISCTSLDARAPNHVYTFVPRRAYEMPPMLAR